MRCHGPDGHTAPGEPFLLRDVVKVEGDNLDAWVDLGNCYATKGIYSESEQVLAQWPWS